MHRTLLGLACALSLLLPAKDVTAQEAVPLDFTQAHWIWATGDRPLGDTVGFRRSAELAAAPVFGRLWVTADAAYQVAVNGEVLGEGDGWTDPEQYDLLRTLKAGANLITIKAVGGRHAGVLVSGRIVDAEGRLLDLVSDGQWSASRQLPEGWTRPEFAAADWPAAVSLGQYGASPWGRLTGMSVGEAQRAYDDLAFGVPDESGTHPSSAFMGQYLDADDANRFLDYLSLDRVTGRFASQEGDSSRLFVRYRQAGGVTSPVQFDWPQYEADLALLASLGFDLALQGFSWPQLLDAEGRWARLAAQPLGTGLPPCEYAYQVLDYALDRAEAHGVHVLALMDLSAPLPGGLLPAEHRDKLLVAESLWDGLLRGAAKIAGRYANRPVLAGWVVGPDALPAFPRSDEPVVRELWETQLRTTYGTMGALRAAWGEPAGLVSFSDVPLPAGPDDLGAADLCALDGQLLGVRMASLAEALRAADPHHLLIAAAGDPTRPLPLAGQLRFNAVATATVLGESLSGPDGVPAYGEALAGVRAAAQVGDSDLAGMLGGGFGGGLRGAYAARALRQEWADVIGCGGAGILTASSLDELTGGGLPGVEQRAGLGSLAKLVAATQADFAAPADGVLVIAESHAAAELTGVRRLLWTLGREGVAAAVAAPRELARGAAPGMVDLDAYQAVILPHAGHDSKLLGLLHEWLVAAPDRCLMLGCTAATAPSQALTDLLGGMTLTAGPANGPRTMSIGAPLTSLPIGRKVAVPEGLALCALGATESDTLRIAGRVSGAAVLAVREEAGSKVLVAGFPLDICGLADGADGTQWLAETVGAAADQAGLGSPDRSPANVAAYVGQNVAVVREVDGASSEIAWRGRAMTPPVAWHEATTRYGSDGSVEVDVALGPYQVVALPVAGEVVGLGRGPAVIRLAGGTEGRMLTVGGEGPAGLALQLAADPERPINLLRPGGGMATFPAGSTDVLVPLDSGMIQVAYGSLAPAGSGAVSDPEAFMTVGDYYVSKGDFGRAMHEFERLGQLYPGTAVATTAAARRQKLLAESGAVVLVNYSRQPVQVRYQGPSTLDTAVPAGQSRTVILYAGDYQEVQKVSGPEWAPAPLTESRSFSVAKGEATVREWGVPAGGGSLNPKLNVRGRLTDGEKESLIAQAKGALPAPPVEAAGGGAGGGGQVAPETTQLTGPELPIVVEIEQEDLQEQKNPPEISVRNRTKEAIELSMVFFSVGVRPRTEVFQLRPRGRLRIELKDTGTYQIEGVVLSNNQLLTFGQFEPDVMVTNNVVIRELSARELKEKADAEVRRGVATSR